MQKYEALSLDHQTLHEAGCGSTVLYSQLSYGESLEGSVVDAVEVKDKNSVSDKAEDED